MVKTLCFQWREGAQVGSLVRELRYHMPQGVAKKKRHESSFFILFDVAVFILLLLISRESLVIEVTGSV